MKPILTFFCLLLPVCPSFAKDKKPNVVMLLSDDLGWKDIGCYGGPVKTPVLDKLAAEGVRFTDFHSGAPGCSHSRASFLTGLHHYRAGVYSVISERLHKMHLLKSKTTIAEVLKENGFATAHFGKWHLGMPVFNRENPTPGDHGFDYWFGLVNGPGPSHKNPTNFIRNGKRVGTMKGYSCQIVVDEALTWLDEKRDADEPFFLNLWFNEPHTPIAAPDEIVSQYGALDDQAAIYSGTIDNTDRAIGRLVARLEKLGELDNTIIIYSSDNGSYRQERNGALRGKKGSQFEGGHRVPGIFYWKGGIPGGRIEDEPAGFVDLLPTLCGLIGIEKPGGVHLDGSDLAPLLTRSSTFERHQPLFWISGANMVVRIGDHTLFASGTAKSPIDFKTADRLMEQIKEVLGDDLEKGLDGIELRSRLFNGRLANPEANRLRNQLRDLYYFNEAWIPELKKSGLGRVQLYDLSKDLSQQNDIAKESPERVARMKKQAAAIYRSVMADAPEWEPLVDTSGVGSSAFADHHTEKFVSIFDGKTLEGWTQRNGTAPYEVKDGAIVGTTKAGSPDSFLCSNKLYGDFELLFEVKVHNSLNSGVQIRSQTKGGPKGRVNGPQVEIEASGANGAESGYLYGEAAGGWMTPKDKLKPHKHFKDGEWNQYRVLAEGARIQTWINGQQISDLVDERKLKTHPRGFIGLQVHSVGNSGPFDVAWRNIQIRVINKKK